MITGIVPRDLDRGERIVALIPVSGRAVVVSLVAPLVPLSTGAFLILHRRDLFDFGVAHFASIHAFVAGAIADRTGIGLELAGIAAYAATGVVLLAVFAFLGRWAAAAVVDNAVELVVRPFKLVPYYLFTARAVTTKSYITKSGIFRSVPTKIRLERIKNRVPRLRGRIGDPLEDDPVIERFRAFTWWMASGLVTPDEFAARRYPNLGALLSYAEPPPALDLYAGLPDLDELESRLRQGVGGKARVALLDSLMPANPKTRTAALDCTPKALGEAQTRIDALVRTGLVTRAEYEREIAAIERLRRKSSSADRGGRR